MCVLVECVDSLWGLGTREVPLIHDRRKKKRQRPEGGGVIGKSRLIKRKGVGFGRDEKNQSLCICLNLYSDIY